MMELISKMSTTVFLSHLAMAMLPLLILSLVIGLRIGAWAVRKSLPEDPDPNSEDGLMSVLLDELGWQGIFDSIVAGQLSGDPAKPLPPFLLKLRKQLINMLYAELQGTRSSRPETLSLSGDQHRDNVHAVWDLARVVQDKLSPDARQLGLTTQLIAEISLMATVQHPERAKDWLDALITSKVSLSTEEWGRLIRSHTQYVAHGYPNAACAHPAEIDRYARHPNLDADSVAGYHILGGCPICSTHYARRVIELAHNARAKKQDDTLRWAQQREAQADQHVHEAEERVRALAAQQEAMAQELRISAADEQGELEDSKEHRREDMLQAIRKMGNALMRLQRRYETRMSGRTRKDNDRLRQVAARLQEAARKGRDLASQA